MNMSSDETKPSSWALVTVIIVIVIGVFLAWKFLLSEPKVEETPVVIDEPAVIEAPLEFPPTIDEPIDESFTTSLPEEPAQTEMPTQELLEPEIIPITPILDDSDSWVQEKLSAIIWRKELLELLIDDDMIRRFVVFVDNFAQGSVVYSHSPFVKPASSFSAKQELVDNTLNKESQIFELDEASFKRFALYVDLFRAVDTETLVEWYQELRPLIVQAYSELGYPDKQFDEVLQASITKVLDLEFPKESTELIRPSVMYQYKSPEIEALDDADKLMLRIGKDNLLVIKSVLLEINEKLNKGN